MKEEHMKTVLLIALFTLFPLTGFAQRTASEPDSIEILSYKVEENKKCLDNVKKMEPRVLTLENSYVHIRNDLQDIKRILETKSGSNDWFEKILMLLAAAGVGSGAILGGQKALKKKNGGGIE
jgi:hypothetical protein